MKKVDDMITQNCIEREVWRQQLADVVTEVQELLCLLQIEPNRFPWGSWPPSHFPLRVPRAFIARMRKGDPNDPLLRQILVTPSELLSAEGFSNDPLQEQHAVAVPGILHKYTNRVLMLVKGGCAIHCRYCFRRHFPYQQHPGGKQHWQQAIDYITERPTIDEVIWSGGDPLIAKDHELSWLIDQLEQIPHLQRLRIHTRLPVVIPSRITSRLTERLAASRLQPILVTHINHAQEIDLEVIQQLGKLRNAGVMLLNQTVLLRGINDCVDTLLALSNALFKAGIVPYYLHQLDPVQGSAHFLVDDSFAKQLWQGLLERTSGYLVPRLVREISGSLSKTPLLPPV